MKQAIKTLEKRIDLLHQKIDESQGAVDEPEMVCDYTFAMADIANWELEVLELQEAIKILNNHQIKVK